MTNPKFDITGHAAAETAFIHFKSTDGELLYADIERKLPVGVEVWGPGSAAFGVVESRQTARAVKRMQDNDGKIAVAPFEERNSEAAEDLATLTRRFVNFDYPPAGDAEGPELFAAFYRDRSLGHLTKQVTQGVSDWGKFKSASGAN